ncbi:MAG: hypothetical protein F4Y44_11720 [Chloroflexi bacterium]|nr:hypothetical protein [Chloroflexota bacterium]
MTGEDFLALASSSLLFGDMLREVVRERSDSNVARMLDLSADGMQVGAQGESPEMSNEAK